jgi:hypothetical protein
MGILTSSTSTALWHDVIHQAETACAVALSEEVESYLVFLLMRYMNKPGLLNQIIALDFLRNVDAAPAQRHLGMQEVGDKCLLYAGLYPKIADKRSVRLSYFVRIGQAAYERISKENRDLYGSLSHQFVSLMDILQSIRLYTQNSPDLLPIQAYELWNDTGSHRALNILRQYTRCSEAMPVLLDTKARK